jgi:cytochrome P450
MGFILLTSGQTTVAAWLDAESFIPERWLGSYKGAESDRGDVSVFSAGSRNCIEW